MPITNKNSLQIGKSYAYVTNNYLLGVYAGETTIQCGGAPKCQCKMPPDTEIFLFSNGQHGKMIFDVGLVEVKTDL